MILSTPVYLRLSLYSEAAHLIGIETIFSEIDSLCLSRIAAVRPRVDAWVLKASVPEIGAVYRGFCPCLRVGVVGAIVIFNSINRTDSNLNTNTLFYFQSYTSGGKFSFLLLTYMPKKTTLRI